MHWFFYVGRGTTTATAVEPTSLFILNRMNLERLKSENPELAMELLKDVGLYIVKVLRKIVDITGQYIDFSP